MPGCCKQVWEFLEFGRLLHGELRRLYHQLGEETRSERVRMWLDYLDRHEEHMEKTLERYERSARGKILDAWLEYSPTLDVEAVMQTHRLPATPGTDDILAAALAFDDTLVRLYSEMADKAVDQHTRELFRNLLALEQQEASQVARAALSLNDL